jgi:thiol-disulfide isomerase/thioredoxin
MKTAFIAALLWLPLTLGATTPARFAVDLEGAKATDSLTLVWWEKTIGGNIELPILDGADHYAPQHTVYAHPDSKGRFVFNIDIPGDLIYFSLYRDVDTLSGEGPKWLLQSYLLEPSDDVLVTIRSGKKMDLSMTGIGVTRYLYTIADRTLQFSGAGSAKDACKYRIDSYCAALYDRKDPVIYLPSFGADGRYIPHNLLEVLLNHSLQTIDSMKEDLGLRADAILKVDYLSLYRGALLLAMRRAMDVAVAEVSGKGFSPRQADSVRLLCLGNLSRFFIDQFLTDTAFAPYSETAKLQSDWYSAYLVEQALTLKYMAYPNDARTSVSALLRDEYAGEIGDKALTLYLLMNFGRIPRADETLKDALGTVSTAFYHQCLETLESLQGVGKPAYDFSLPDIKGNLVRLGDFRGKVVFIDFWFTGCGACQAFYKNTLSEVEHALKGNPNVVFVTVCVDAQRATWKKSLESGVYTSGEVVNLYTGGRGNTDPVVDGYHVMGYPHPFLIDREGKILRTDQLQTSANELTRFINEALAK